MTARSLTIKDPSDYEKVVARYFKQLGYEVTMPPTNTLGYDIELNKDSECIAVQVKNYRVKCNIAHIQRFQHFIELPVASRFTQGWFISASGYTKPALTHVQTERAENLRLGIFEFESDRVRWVYPGETLSPLSSEKRKYIGVFTCKGGVGKTTVAAHLAGAFALMGHDVILLDLDPDRNLRKLFLQNISDIDEDASIYVPPVNRNEPGTTITVLNSDEWEERDYPEVKIVICDCSPVLKENPASLVEKFDYCIIPTTLNPLGISKGGDVIIRTFKHIRKNNPTTEMFALVNDYNSSRTFDKYNQTLYVHLKDSLSSYTSVDSKCKLIDPRLVKIRHSNALLYWGYHIVAGTKPQLAFREIAGRSYPRTDFLQLAEYLEDHTEIDQLRQR